MRRERRREREKDGKSERVREETCHVQSASQREIRGTIF